MADERDAKFVAALARMSDQEVREQIDPGVQSIPFLRAMAATELEKRRQTRTDALLRPRLSLGWLAARLVGGILILGALGGWLLWAGYIG